MSKYSTSEVDSAADYMTFVQDSYTVGPVGPGYETFVGEANRTGQTAIANKMENKSYGMWVHAMLFGEGNSSVKIILPLPVLNYTAALVIICMMSKKSH